MEKFPLLMFSKYNDEPDLSLLSLQPSIGGSAYVFGSQKTTIFAFELNSQLFRAQYYSEDGVSGCPIVSEALETGELVSTLLCMMPPPIKKLAQK